MAEIWNWLVLEGWGLVRAALGSALILSVVGLLLKDTIAKFFAKSVDHHFEKRIEEFRAEIRESEKELDQIRSFISSARSERHSLLLSKKMEAAECLLQARNYLSKFSLLVEYMKILDKDYILKRGSDSKITDFINVIISPFQIDENLKAYSAFDKTLARLYLGEKTIKIFDAYEAIIFNAVMMMKLYGIELQDKSSLMKTGHLMKVVTDLAPGAKEGFEKYGDDFAYHWSSYFYDETLRSLRHEVSGADDAAHDATAAERVARDARQVQARVRGQLAVSGLPDELIKERSAEAATAMVQRITGS